MSRLDDVEDCRNCGQSVLMMCQRWTGFCSAECEEQWIDDEIACEAKARRQRIRA